MNKKIPKEIDSILDGLYENNSDFRELAQLAILFGPRFLSQLAAVLAKEILHVSNDSLQVSLGWIDKTPLADFIKGKIKDHNGNLVTRRVEIGDALLVFRKIVAHEKPKSYALIFQAKKASSRKCPKVPVDHSTKADTSSAKELALLSMWPNFDLYKASRSKVAIKSSIDVDKSASKIFSYGWYGACPPDNKSGWPSRWMCAPSKKNAKCSFTMGHLIDALVNRKKLGGNFVGEVFKDFSQSSVGIDNASQWDILISELLKQCRNNKPPKLVSKVGCISRLSDFRAFFARIDMGQDFILKKYDGFNFGSFQLNECGEEFSRGKSFPVLMIELSVSDERWND